MRHFDLIFIFFRNGIKYIKNGKVYARNKISLFPLKLIAKKASTYTIKTLNIIFLQYFLLGRSDYEKCCLF